MRYKFYFLCLIIIPVCSSLGFNEKLGLRMKTARIQSISGSYNDSLKMVDYLEQGMSYGIGIHHRVSENYSIEVSFNIGWMTVKKEYREDLANEPVFFFPQISFSNFISFPVWRIIPYSRVGASIVPWKFTTDGPGGAAEKFEGENFQKMSFSIHGGLGLEVKVTDWLGLYAEGIYHYLLSRDQFFFGKGFTEQGVLSLGGGILVYPFQ